MTKSTITREQVIALIAEHSYDSALVDALEYLLAAMDSEPVAYMHDGEDGTEYNGHNEFSGGGKGIPLYRHAQPAPEYPETLPCPVFLEPGLRFGKGIKTSSVLAALARRAVYESDMAALSPEERAEFQARIEDFKALIAQPAPVVPDGYVMVPKEMTDEIGEAIAMQANCCGGIALDIYDAMLAAAPQQPGSEPATVPGKWIPVSEQMPPSRHEVLVGRWWGEKPRWCCKWATYIPGHHDAQSSGWLIPGASWTPTHWMPLPAAPQEVK
ncbi:TPA: DUF551 domain-containing protein [Klebsiella pneumoniae]